MTYDMTLETQKNTFRLPPYRRFDIGLFYNTKIFGLKSEIYFQIVNIYNFKNVWFRFYDFETNPAKREEFYMLPRIPTAGISFMF